MQETGLNQLSGSSHNSVTKAWRAYAEGICADALRDTKSGAFRVLRSWVLRMVGIYSQIGK